MYHSHRFKGRDFLHDLYHRFSFLAHERASPFQLKLEKDESQQDQFKISCATVVAVLLLNKDATVQIAD